MRLLLRGGQPFRLGAASVWALSWGVGAGLGVAAGAWLTVVGEAGAPGIESIDPSSEFIALPLAALGVVAVLSLLAQLALAAWRGVRSAQTSLETDEGSGHSA